MHWNSTKPRKTYPYPISMGSIIREWLPPPVAEAVKHEDPERFRATFKALEDEWLANKHLEAGQRGLETLKWVAIVNG